MSSDSLAILNSFARNLYSQFGEDGIICEILDRVDRQRDQSTRYCVEFGAWDGIFLSNTYNLIKNRGYHAVLIEANHGKFETLCKNVPQDTVTKVRKFVAFEGSTTLDAILSETQIPKSFDLLSIDIDGNDYHVFKSLDTYHPLIVCIEYNPTIPNAVEYIQPKEFSVTHGSSAKSIVKLAHMKGYALVASTKCNLIFVDRSVLEALGLAGEPSLEDIRNDRDIATYAFVGYDGTIFLSQSLQNPWYPMKITGNDLQVLPRFLRTFPDNYNGLQRLLFFFHKCVRRLKRLCLSYIR